MMLFNINCRQVSTNFFFTLFMYVDKVYGNIANSFVNVFFSRVDTLARLETPRNLPRG